MRCRPAPYHHSFDHPIAARVGLPGLDPGQADLGVGTAGARVVADVNALCLVGAEVEGDPESFRYLDRSRERHFDPPLGTTLEAGIGGHLRAYDLRNVLVQEEDQEALVRRIGQTIPRAVNPDAYDLLVFGGQGELDHLTRAAQTLLPIRLAVAILQDVAIVACGGDGEAGSDYRCAERANQVVPHD